MSWVFFAAIGYLLLAVAVLGDKLILRKVLPRPASYAFWQGVMSLGVLILIPFGFSILPGERIFLSFLSGGLFLYALYLFFHALRLADASRVQPIILSLTPLILFGLESYVLKTEFSANQIIAALFLIAGSVVLSFDFEKKEKAGYKIFILYSLGAAVLFALSAFLMKELFVNEGFFNVLIWTRLGMFLGALSLLIFAGTRASIFSSSKVMKSSKASGGVLLNKVLGAVGTFFISLALSRGPATLVNALQGLQYAFLFAIAIGLYFFLPGVIRENLGRRAIIQKVSGMVLVSIGLFILFL